MTGATETNSVARRGRLVLMCLMVMAPASAASAQGWPPWADGIFQDRRSWSREPYYRQETPERPYTRRQPEASAEQSGGPRPDIVPRTPPVVSFTASYPAKSIVIDTSTRKLYFVLDGNQAYEYRISVGREGFNWTGTETISRKQAWPDWYPPAEMRERDPKLPEKMTGGVRNPLGAMALYLGNTLYRIHGTNDVKSIGQAQSSGCFRMLNAEVLHLASIVEVGTTVSVVNSLAVAPEVGRKMEPSRSVTDPLPEGSAVAQAPEASAPTQRSRDYQTLRLETLRRP
jgi:lipoprotein-anchoring transpeptidase ErfK/SrfK